MNKDQRQNLNEIVDSNIHSQQKKLVKRGVDNHDENDDEEEGEGINKKAKVTTANAVREFCQAESQKNRGSHYSMEIDCDEEGENIAKTKSSNARKKKASTRQPTKKKGRAPNDESEDEFVDDDDSEDFVQDSPPNGRKKSVSSRKATQSKSRGRKAYDSESDFDDNDDDDIVEDYSPPKKRRTADRAGGRGKRKATINKSYKDDIIEIDEDDDDVPMTSGWGVANSQPKRAGGRR